MPYFNRSATMQVAFDAFLELGGIPARLLDDLRVHPTAVLDSGAWVERGACLELLAVLRDMAGDPCIGLHLARKNDWAHLGSWARGIVSAPTLAGAIENAARNLPLVETGSRLELVLEDDRACLRLTYEKPYEARPDQFLVADVYSLSRILGLARDPVLFSARLAVDRPPRRCADEVARLLGPETAFGAPASELIFPRSALSLPLDENARARVMDPLTRQPRAGGTGRQVIAELEARLELEPVHLAEVAGDLGLSLRTVQRHLAAWGLTFEEVLDDFRKRRAAELIRNPRYTVTDVAFRLGYSDSAHFTRAFKRWYGTAPSKCRKAPSAWLPREPASAAF